MALAEKIEYLLQLSCLYEGDGFDLVSLGVKWTRGCYCAPNDILRVLIPELAGSYGFTIVDSPAGLEHLNRRVVHEIDDVFVVVDPSGKSIRNAEAVRDMAAAIGMRFDNLYMIANHRVTADQEPRLSELPGASYLGKIALDPAVERYDWEGRSLLDLPDESPACVSVQAILRKARYAAEGAEDL